jgi:alkanesulfonate monooxygenase SsuD/methylene tetrahydromethanopterin reductase-like flavin-dependent oxidoreductase (luciferase family)
MVGNHIADVLRHHNPDNLPNELTEYVQGRPDYDYRQHAEQGTEHSQYVPDEIIDRFCILGSLEQCEAKMRKLAEIGVSEFNLYPHVEGIESVIETLGRELAPRLRETVAA